MPLRGHQIPGESDGLRSGQSGGPVGVPRGTIKQLRDALREFNAKRGIVKISWRQRFLDRLTEDEKDCWIIG